MHNGKEYTLKTTKYQVLGLLARTIIVEYPYCNYLWDHHLSISALTPNFKIIRFIHFSTNEVSHSSSTDRWDHSHLVTSLQQHSLIRTNVLLVHSNENVLCNLDEADAMRKLKQGIYHLHIFIN